MKKTLLLLLLSISCYAQDVVRIDLRFTPNLHKPTFDYIQANWKLYNKLPKLPPKTHYETDTIQNTRWYYLIDLKNDRCEIIGVEEIDGKVFHFKEFYINHSVKKKELDFKTYFVKLLKAESLEFTSLKYLKEKTYP